MCKMDFVAQLCCCCICFVVLTILQGTQITTRIPTQASRRESVIIIFISQSKYTPGIFLAFLGRGL